MHKQSSQRRDFLFFIFIYINLPLQKSKSNAAGIPNSSSCCCCFPSPMPTTGPNPIDTSCILLLFFAVSLLLFVIIAFFTLYFCRSMFIHRSNSAAPGLAPPAPQALDDNAVGLDPSLVASFPTFTYSWVKNLHAGKCGLECAVCLSEFQDDDVLRLLTACSHVFHTDCIDFWLISHTTCPYCRHELNTEEKKSPEVRIVVAEGREAFEEMRGGEEEERLQQQQRRSVSSFKEEGEEGRAEDEGGRSGDWKRMLRSNWTVHSSIGREDRYTLRLLNN